MADLNKIAVIKKLFFNGNATIKFRSDFHAPDSLDSNFELYKIDQFYDIVINDIIQITDSEFYNQKQNIVCDFLSKSDKVIVEHHKDFYEIEAQSFFCSNQITPYHIQNEGEVVHGFFKNIRVFFEIEKEEIQYVLSEEIKTPFNKGHYDSVSLDSKKSLLNESKIVSTRNTLKSKCIQDKYTGRERNINGWIEREFQNSDCSTYWKKDREVLTNNNGCFAVLAFIFLVIIILLYVFFFFFSGQFLVMLAWFLLIGIISGISYLFDFLSNSRNKHIGNLIFGFFRLLLASTLIFLFISGFPKLFDSNSWNSSRDNQIIQTENYEFIEDNKTSPVIPAPFLKDSSGNKNSDFINDSIVIVKRKWRGLDNKIYQGKYKLYLSMIRNSERKIQNLPKYNNFTNIYSDLYENDKNGLKGLYTMLDSIKIANNQNNLDFANTIVSMVQTIKYSLVLENACNTDIYNDFETKNMINSANNCLGFSPYGLRTPLQFMSDLKGDCDTRTLLLFTIFSHYNYDVAIINSDVYKHSMIGLNLKNVNGAFKMYNGKQYYFWETTNTDFKIGNLPIEYGNLNYWNITLN